ncbi:MAG TPA: transglutaminase-like domain-containing protein [Rhodocyclaceae bacterium]|nr:transglutaminase-like domain-containing protein [Rhodocyclaceae bacterium]
MTDLRRRVAGRAMPRLLLATVVCMAILAAFLGVQAIPSTEAVRLRNALLVEPSSPADFTWTPAQVPAGFLQDAGPVEPLFADVVRNLGIAALPDDRAKALALSAHLSQHADQEGPIQSDLQTTYHAIRKGAGYCADYTAVYLALARAAGLFAREWGFSFDGFGGHGHAVVEVFDRQHQRWMFLDVFNNFHPVYADSGEILSVAEFRAFLHGEGPAVRIVKTGPGRAGMKYEDKLLAYYRHGMDQWYLWWGNAVFDYERAPVVAALGHVSRSLEQLGAIVAGVHPHVRIVETPSNQALVARMTRLATQIRVIAAVEAVLAFLMLVQILAWRRSGRRENPL